MMTPQKLREIIGQGAPLREAIRQGLQKLKRVEPNKFETTTEDVEAMLQALKAYITFDEIESKATRQLIKQMKHAADPKTIGLRKQLLSISERERSFMRSVRAMEGILRTEQLLDPSTIAKLLDGQFKNLNTEI